MASPIPLGDYSKLDIPTLPGMSAKKQQSSTFWSSNPLFTYLNNVYTNIAEHRNSLNLENPGTIENLNKEVSRDVFVNQYFFTGLKADLNKSFSLNPAFQTSHSLSIGSQQLPPYAFSALFAKDDCFIQANLDNEFSLSGRLNYAWNKFNTSKVTLQLSNGQPAMCQLEHDYQGYDYSINLKALNPSFLQGSFTGVAVGSLLQSVTPKLAVGLETVYSAPQPGFPADAVISYVGRYNNDNKWIASAQLQGQGALVTSFWKKISKEVEAGIETQLQLSAKPIVNPQGIPIGYQPVFEGVTTIGAKYEFRASLFRGQIDSQGKVACFLERRILPTVAILFSGEINQLKNQSRLGLGLQFEAAGSEQLLMIQNGMLDANGNPIQGVPVM